MSLNVLQKIRRHASDALQPGEEFLAAAPLTARGTAAHAGAYVGVGGLLGGALGAAGASYQAGKDWRSVGAFRASSVSVGARGALAVATNQRFLVFQQSAMGRPKEILGEWPVHSVRLQTNLHRPGALAKIKSLFFVLPDHTVLAAECTAMGSLARQIDALQCVLNGPDPAPHQVANGTAG